MTGNYTLVYGKESTKFRSRRKPDNKVQLKGTFVCETLPLDSCRLNDPSGEPWLRYISFFRSKGTLFNLTLCQSHWVCLSRLRPYQGVSTEFDPTLLDLQI